tara:strand:- start:108 stop:1178 length:1071 start_codon:yes stop_codon:yes gene_type:complete
MSKIYFPNLNGLRFFAALSVMIYHFFGIEVLYGHYGVILFFVLSGFLITYLLLEEKERLGKIEIRKFYVRRILRIWPLYFIILLIATFVYFTSSEYISSESYLQAIPYYLFFAPNIAFVLHIGLNYAGILWSVGSEEQFYLIWPWITRKIQKKKFLFLLILIILCWTVVPYFIDYVNHNYLSNQNSLSLLSKLISRTGFAAMATGATIACILKMKPKIIDLILNNYIHVAATLAIIVIWISDILPHSPATDEIFSILFAIIVANYALNPNVFFKLENKVLNYLGKISFGLYVFHLISFDIIKNLDIEISIFMGFILGIVLTIVISTVSYYAIEVPFLRLKSKKYTTISSGNSSYKN